MNDSLIKFIGTRRKGKGELWLDPYGNEALLYDCEISIDKDALHYSWHYEDEVRRGSFTFDDAGVTWVDTWHQQSPVQCTDVPGAWGIFTVSHEYETPAMPNWGWRSKLPERPDGALVLQMTNIAPWGEEGRAVRMTFAPEGA